MKPIIVFDAPKSSAIKGMKSSDEAIPAFESKFTALSLIVRFLTNKLGGLNVYAMKVLFATGNEHKASEANLIGTEFGVSFKRVDCPYPEVRDEDVKVVAREGAKYVYGKLAQPVIVEDAGLFIDALDGFPGSYSSFVFKKIGNEGILRLLEGEANRKARFVSAVGYADGSEIKIFEGVIEGEITGELRGDAGFGYDPIFKPAGSEKTFAEDPKFKNTVSHRRKSVQEFCEFLKKS